MGEVYLADDVNLKRRVALKFLRGGASIDSTSRARFQREAEAAAQLSSPNIVTVYEIGDHKGSPFIAMEYVEGTTLDVYAGAGKLPEANVIALVLGIVRGLEKAHRAGIVHRDLKPTNVVIDSDGQPRILDFGVAQVTHSDRLTASGQAVGTLAYMAPEQLEGAPIDHRSDIWSVGVILYELIAHRRPFAGNRLAALIYEIINADPFPLSRVSPSAPPGIDQIISKCLAKKPQDRYATSAELIADLNALATGQDDRTIPLPSLPKNNKAWLIGIGAVLVIAVAAIGYLIKNRLAETDHQPPVATLIVAPFRNLGDPDQDYFADGLTDELSTRIGHLKNLRVISHASAMTLKSQTKTAREIGNELGAQYVLEGTVRWQTGAGGSRVRITPRLVRASDNQQLWSDAYDRNMADVFAIQTEIAENVAGNLNLVLFADDRTQLESRPTSNLAAYDLYLQANSFFNRSYSRPDIEESIRLYAQAVEQDPAYVAAWARQSWAHSRMYWFGHDQSPDRLKLARSAVNRALKLDSNSADCHIALGYLHYWGYRDYPSALKEFFAAKAQLPSSSDVREGIGYVLRRQGHFDSALVQIAEAVRLDPKSHRKLFEYGNTFYQTRQWEKADSLFVRASELSPRWALPYSRRARLRVYAWTDIAGAGAILDSAATQLPASDLAEDQTWIAVLSGRYRDALQSASLIEDTVFKQLEMGRILNNLADSTSARAHFDSAKTWLGAMVAAEPENAPLRRYLATAYAGLGRCEDAVRESDKAVQLLPIAEDAFFGGPGMLEGQVQTLVACNLSDGIVDKISRVIDLPAGVLTKRYLAIAPEYSLLKSLPEFQALLRDTPQ